MKKAFEEGWGAVIAKTISVDSSKVGALSSVMFGLASAVPGVAWHI